MRYVRKSSYTPNKTFQGKHRFEHWYRDNQIYFITARCRDRFHAFASDDAKAIFWDRFGHYTKAHGFEPFVTSLLVNHYHTVGHLRIGRELGPMMQKIHGSVAKLVNDTLATRRVPFWHDGRHRDYFDGCLRDEKQFRQAYRYTLSQAKRAGIAGPWPHTRVAVGLEEGLARAVREKALLWGVRYKRYDDRAGGQGR